MKAFFYEIGFYDQNFKLLPGRLLSKLESSGKQALCF